MKSIYQMELEDKFNRKIKYREKKIETQRKIIGEQREQIFQLKEQLQQKENIIKEVREKLHICSIGKNCRGKSKTAGGFIWKFKEVK